MDEIQNKFDQIPPFLVFALSRKDNRRLTIEQVVEASGLSRRTVERLSVKLTWKREKLFVIDRFCVACGVSLLKKKDAMKYFRSTMQSTNRPFRHLNEREYSSFCRLCKAFTLAKSLAKGG